MKFIHSTDGVNVDSLLTLADHTGESGWYQVAWNPESQEGKCAVVSGYHRDGDVFVADFSYRDVPTAEEEATEADKDAALRGFGVEV